MTYPFKCHACFAYDIINDMSFIINNMLLQIGSKLEFYELINDIINDIIEQVCQNSDDLLLYVKVLGKWTK